MRIKSIRRRVLTGLERLPIIRIIFDHLGKEGMAPHADFVHIHTLRTHITHTTLQQQHEYYITCTRWRYWKRVARILLLHAFESSWPAHTLLKK
jgi:hypothetical protein